LALFTSGLMAISAVLVLFSWLPDPILSTLGWLPDSVGRWADHPDNINIRTAVPMLLWGLSAGMILHFNQSKIRWWIFSGIAGTFLVAIAEWGQLWIPNRHPDIFWGCLGLNAGLIIVRGFGRWFPVSKPFQI
jgi:hypothetical protein